MSFLQILGINGAIGTIVVLVTAYIMTLRAEKKYGEDAVEAHSDDVKCGMRSICDLSDILCTMLCVTVLIFAWEIFLPAHICLYNWMVSRHSNKKEP